MNTKQVEAYTYYKRLYPRALLLFRLEDHYAVLMDDAATVSQELSLTAEDGYVALPLDPTLISRLGEQHEIHIVMARNDRGERDFPDIEQIQADQEADY